MPKKYVFRTELRWSGTWVKDLGGELVEVKDFLEISENIFVTGAIQGVYGGGGHRRTGVSGRYAERSYRYNWLRPSGDRENRGKSQGEVLRKKALLCDRGIPFE